MYARPGRLRSFLAVPACTGGCHSAKRHAKTVSDFKSDFNRSRIFKLSLGHPSNMCNLYIFVGL
jgi:hypothetical protein